MGMQVDFFWDCVSPYTYLAATQIDALAQSTGADIRWRPFLLGGVFQATGNQPPAVLPPRGRYLMQDVQRWASHYGVPLKMPKAFPTNTLMAQRLACALDDHGQQVQLGQALMHAYWGEGRNVGEAAVLEEVLNDQGLDAKPLFARAAEAAVKQRLKDNTDEAVQRGAFGAPSFFVGNALFWGNDRLALLKDHLKRLAA